MTDGIIKGTGNSRFLKAPANALTLYPTHESLMEALVAGTFPIDLNGINPAGWNAVGDKLDKSTLLTDALCTALGLSTTATPAQAMEKLREMVNTKLQIETGSYIGSDNSLRTLTFSFAPLIVFLQQGKKGSEVTYKAISAVFIRSSPYATTTFQTSNVEWFTSGCTWGDNTLQFSCFANQYDGFVFDRANYKYYYTAIG